MVLSQEVESIRLLSGENEMEWTQSVCSSNVAASSPVFESQTWTVLYFLSFGLTAIHFPSGETAVYHLLLGVNPTARMPAACLFEGPDTQAPVSIFQTQTSPPHSTETILFPSEENATKST